jgi:hypothetical protein
VQPVAVRILHPRPGPAAGPLERSLAAAREANANRLAVLFRRTGVDDVRIEAGVADGLPFGARLRLLTEGLPHAAGLVVLGSGAIPLASRRDVAQFTEVAAGGDRRALANSFYSADVVAVASALMLRDVPDLPGDNALPRWLEEVAGFEADDLARRWRLAVDLDSPLDVLLTGGPLDAAIDRSLVDDRLDRLRGVAGDQRAELLVAGRTNAATLRWLERSTASRTRALVEERGLRASTPAAMPTTGRQAAARPPRSILGLVLEERGPEALGSVVAELGDGALIDSRVLLAHRLGADEAAWPSAEDRFASDLLLPDRIADPWLRALTVAARDASVPVLLGGHTLVGPGIRLALGKRR